MTSGGSRPGSGRKKGVSIIPAENKRVQISVSISPETKDRLSQLRDRGVKIGKLIDELVRKYWEEK